MSANFKLPGYFLLLLTIFSFLTCAILISNQNIPMEARAQSGPTSSEFVHYNGSKYGMNIEYPANWNLTEDTSGVWFISPVDQTGNIRIQSEPTQNLSLAKLVQAQLLISKASHKLLNVTSSNTTILDGNPANRTDFKFRDEIPKFLGADIVDYISFQVSAVKGDKLYTFIYFSTPENYHLFLPIAQKMLGTLKILE